MMKTVYMTKTGIVGAEIHIDAAKDSYRWSGKWGAGSGYGVAEFAKRFSEMLASKRGAYLESGPAISSYIRKGNPTMKKTARKSNPSMAHSGYGTGETVFYKDHDIAEEFTPNTHVWRAYNSTGKQVASGKTLAAVKKRIDTISNGRKANPSEIHIDIGSHNTKGRNVRAKNPAPKKVYFIVAVDRRRQGAQGGDPFGRFTPSDIAGWYTGAHFDTDKKKAAAYRTHAAAYAVAETLKGGDRYKIAVYSPGKA